MKYDKLPIELYQQLDLLKQRELLVADEDKALEQTFNLSVISGLQAIGGSWKNRALPIIGFDRAVALMK